MGLLDGLKSLLPSEKTDLTSRFERQREAISGTMSTFYLAVDRKTREKVGLKILDPEKTAAFETRFQGLAKPSEGQIAASLDHPLLVKTLEHGVTKTGEQYLVMEFLEGTGLNSLIVARDQRLKQRRLTLIRKAAEALAALHEAGYIHRDVCPRNYVASPECDSVKLIDFGLTLPATEPFMKPGNRTGTPTYMAPEIVRRRRTDQRADIFAFGVTAYEMCAFERPWPGSETTGKAAMAHGAREPIDLCEACPDIDPALSAVIMQCLKTEPGDRPRTMNDLLAKLRRVTGEGFV
jgi:serine/threonine protein kinase